MSENSFNPFLREEWKQKKKSDLHFYKDLVTFLNNHVADIKLKTEEEKQLLIRNLSQSPDFLTTHGIIAMLRKYSEWTDDQIEELCKIADQNTQVAWILYDEDIASFYNSLLCNANYTELEDSAIKKIADVYSMHNMYKSINAESDYKAEVMESQEGYYKH